MAKANKKLIELKGKRVIALTGAGVSAESGAPTFRDSGGLWEGTRPEDVATPEAFFGNPEAVWQWYDARRNHYQKIKPNPAHLALAELEKMNPGFHVITQNIDGLHQRAGNQNVIELHGNIWKARCVEEETIADLLETPMKQIPPMCQCGSMLRPHVVWFGEVLPFEEFALANKLCKECDVLLVIGTSSIVYPVASLPHVTKQHGGKVIEINMEYTPLSDIADQTLLGKAGEILPEICKY